jgi:hypothetical protein
MSWFPPGLDAADTVERRFLLQDKRHDNLVKEWRQ